MADRSIVEEESLDPNLGTSTRRAVPHKELHRFGKSVVRISETKWFGSAVYDVNGNSFFIQIVLYLGKVRR